MKRDVDSALDQCLVWLREGRDVPTCLARYPEYAAELRPLLECAAGVGQVISPIPSTAGRSAGQRRMLTALAQKRERDAASHPLGRAAREIARRVLPRITGGTKTAWQVAAMTLLVALVAASGLAVSASTDSLPGEALYPVKTVSQRVQLALTFNPARHRLLADQFDTQRRLDIQDVLVAGRQLTVEFEGLLQGIKPDLWRVGGLPVTIDEATTIAGQPSAGALVHVRARLPGDGRLIALSVSVRLATTPRPTPSLMPTEPTRPTATRTPTRTPTPTETPEPTETLTATETSETAREQLPVQTAQPTETIGASEAPPLGTMEPTEQPVVTGSEEHEEEAEPVVAPELEETPEPDGTSVPDAILAPTETPASGSQPEREREEESDGGLELEGQPAPDGTLEPAQTREPDSELDRDHDDESHSDEAPMLDVEPDHDDASENSGPSETGHLSEHDSPPHPSERLDD